MRRVLVLGGYGGFGGRISRRLASEGFEVVVAGRSLAKATAYCAGHRNLVAARLDRAQIADGLSKYRPVAVVDASGPFQKLDLTVPRAAIAAGVHYCDIADSTAFVTSITALDAEAKAAGVTVLSGASSVPALSGAAARELAQGIDKVTQVEIAISASSQATAGGAVAAAIIGGVGQAFTLQRGRRLETVHGWQEMTRQTFSVKGCRPLKGRLVALVDVPDVALLPPRLPGNPSVVFRAGGELGFQNLALWFLSWPVRWGWIGGIASLSRWLLPLQRITAWMGGDRSAMIVRLFGEKGEQRIERRWTLIAQDGDGPEIPTLAIAPLVARMVERKIECGARDAGQALTLDDYAPAFASLAIAHACEEFVMPQTLYRRVMGKRFDQLPPAVRAIHDVMGDGGAHGEARVTGSANWLGALIARVVGFPRAGHHKLHVAFAEADGVERWTRHFGNTEFRSTLSERNGTLVERFGPARFSFDLPSDAAGLTMVMRRWSVFGFRLPLALAPRTLAREWEDHGRFQFDVAIELPLIGRVVHYRGWLLRLTATNPRRLAMAS